VHPDDSKYWRHEATQNKLYPRANILIAHVAQVRLHIFVVPSRAAVTPVEHVGTMPSWQILMFLSTNM
jgi:hypothetical protein